MGINAFTLQATKYFSCRYESLMSNNSLMPTVKKCTDTKEDKGNTSQLEKLS